MVRMTNARRPRIRPRSSLTPTAPMPAGGPRQARPCGEPAADGRAADAGSGAALDHSVVSDRRHVSSLIVCS